MEQFLQTETIVIELLLIVSVVALAVRRYRLPYTVALVLVGLVLTVQQPLEFNLTPELILALFVPPLVFEAAFHLSAMELRRNLVAVLALAVPGVVVTTLIVGGVVSWFTAVSLPLALVFGALIAATDPVAVVALFRAFGVPKRLSVLVEGESLLNDGTAIVVFSLVLAAAQTGHFNLAEGLFEFVRVAAVGLFIGAGLGWLVSFVIARVDDYLIETTLTTILAFGSYLLAERVHASGVLAVVAAGLVAGNIGPRGMSPTTRIVLFNFWEYVAFLANSLIFLLIGLQVNLPALVAAWESILVAIVAVLVARVIVVYGFGALVNRFVAPLSLSWLHVMSWGGLRGAISLALVLSLPLDPGPERDSLLAMSFGVVLFTLLVQGTTMGALLKRLGIVGVMESRLELERSHARLTALRSAEAHLENLHREGLVQTHAWESLRPMLAERIEGQAAAVSRAIAAEPALEAEGLETAQREVIRAQRSALFDLRREGVISEEVFQELAEELDADLDGKRPADH
ncbi:MAG: Na+/H+ antiporter [Chloroflexota bacterium]